MNKEIKFKKKEFKKSQKQPICVYFYLYIYDVQTENLFFFNNNL